ncbi:transcriptional regulator [Tersicoccus solisilvae]|uniref:Transcriptional regulator n=1 Tax=Tersicoccus solisilvae TaxID=1882339 RepID=A0ABQ1NK74_9MICC|nr:ATP-binding protein [Tersicoccus solisilvae]GGC79173.1 transcriptional regulator [Tersicoccus solisilvae]
MPIIFGQDPVRAEVESLLRRIDRGETVDRTVERSIVDLKEEAGRRDRSGVILPGQPTNEAAAKALAAEAACMANTPGGGALIVGVADDGQVLGTQLEVEWLRHRIYELSHKLLTVDVANVTVADHRLLVVVSPSAVEPVRINGRITWRVGDHCVEIDAATWHARRMQRLNYDWSADVSTVPVAAVRPAALAVARDFLRASGEGSAEDLAQADDFHLLRRLNVVLEEGMLTNAGVITLVGRGTASVDYVHRDYAGGDSTARVRRQDRSLLEELSEVFLTVEAHNSMRHIQTRLVVRQIRDIPMLAAREAVVNGLAHREWGVEAPTVIEHVGRTLRVTSPGGFFGGVNESNIITHPSQSRNPALAQLLADLRVAEREGIGVDRMVREMIRVGHQQPLIREIEGPYVRASLVGDALDESWIAWLAQINPPEEAVDVSSLLVLRHLANIGWVDERSASVLVQLPPEEARGTLLKLARAQIGGGPLVVAVEGTPAGTATAWRLSPQAQGNLASLDQDAARTRNVPTRTEIARSYAQARGRISSTEFGSLVGASPSNVGSTLKALAIEGVLEPSSAAGRGRGFFYRWAGGDEAGSKHGSEQSSDGGP